MDDEMDGVVERVDETDQKKKQKQKKQTPPNQPEENSRDHWGGQAEFLLACLGNCVGLGNCWRFPYLCFKNGGGAFLFPYIICCLVIGFPLFLIELSLGQFSAMGPAHLWANLSPLFKGVGIASVISSAIVAIYYNMIIAWTLFYFVESLIGQHWQKCGHWFNSVNCTTVQSGNFTNSSVSSSEEFFNNYILAKSPGIDVMTDLNWKLVGALAASWLIVVLALIKGIQSSGKVVYFTATFPYVILAILFARGVTLDGASDGLWYLFTPNWARVKDLEVWRDAAVQVFYSFGVGGGGMITYASYNAYRNPVVKHSLIVGMGDFLTSIFCGAVVFTMIGYMAHALGKPIDSIVQSGTGLAFIVIPEGLSKMPVSILWSMLFFAMLFLLGIDSQFAMVETVITYIFDTMRNKKHRINKPLVVCLVGFFWFLGGLPLCTNAGVYILNLMDTYSAGIPCLVIAATEILIIVVFYGFDRFFLNLAAMTGWRPNTVLKSHIVVTISAIAPAVILTILYREVGGLVMAGAPPLTYGTYQYPDWANRAGIAIALLSISSIPLYMAKQAAVHLCGCASAMNGLSFGGRLRALVQPTDLWWRNHNANGGGGGGGVSGGDHLHSCSALPPPPPLTPLTGKDNGSILEMDSSYSSNMSTFDLSAGSVQSLQAKTASPTSTPTTRPANAANNGHVNAAMDETEF